MDLITTRWGILIFAALVSGPKRFSRLHHMIGGISEKMLAQKLKSLVSLGLIDRLAEPVVPPQVTYRLTAHGESLIEPLFTLIDWLGDHVETMAAAQASHDTYR